MRPSRRGNVFVVNLTFVTSLGFGAFAVDVGVVRVARAELQAALDAATLSACSELDGTTDGVDRAVDRALEIAAMNPAFGGGLQLAANEVHVGWRDPDTHEFVEWLHGTDPGPVDTVVIEHAPESIPGVLGLAAFGREEYLLTSDSTALRPFRGLTTKAVRCMLPIAIPSCWLTNLQPDTNPPPFKFTFSPTPTDKIAWADPLVNPNTTDVRDALLKQCRSYVIRVGHELHVNEGNLTSAVKAVQDVLNGVASTAADTWDPNLYGPLPARDGTADTANTPSQSSVASTRWGKTLEGVVPLVDAGEDCSAVSFTGTVPITGFAWGVVYDVRASGNDKNLYLQLDVKNTHRVWGEPDPSLRGNIQTPGLPVLGGTP